MTTVLIPTKPDDTHAIYVKLALEKIGHRADIWCTADLPSRQAHSLEINEDDISWCAIGVNCDLSDTQYDVIWYRRPSKPVLPNILHPEDVQNAKKENDMLFHTLWQVIQPSAVWINPPHAAWRASSKLLQLKLAAQAGMKIPRTLISNNPRDIKKYLQSRAGRVIYKTLYPMTWLKQNEVRLTYTRSISVDDLPSDHILQMTPGIFQERIDKKHELRVTYFGDQPVAVKINSQQHEKARQDWRFAPTKELSLECVTLPASIDEACRKMMNKLGIVFGCFDFIVTPEDDYYFLEVNEQGQFLWIEEVNSDIKMLQYFVNFLISHNDTNKIYSDISLSDFTYQMTLIKKSYESIHQSAAVA